MFTVLGMRFLVKRLRHKYNPDFSSTISNNIKKNKKTSHYSLYVGFCAA